MVVEFTRNGDGEIVERKTGRMSKYPKVANFVNGRAQIQAQFHVTSNSRHYSSHCPDHGLILPFPLSFSQVKGPGVGLLGISKGGDLCLSMASFLKGITATIIINGSVANVGGALHYKGETLPPVGIDPTRLKVTSEGFADILDVLNSPLEGPDQKSFIPVERAESAFLFLVGQDDHNWKSEFYASEASKRLQAHGKERPQIICYPGAGHYIEPPYFPMCPASMHTLVGRPVIWGGEPRAHAMAQVDAWKQLQAFFHKHLGGKELG
uniref:BAAT/Acyl-CoA thioester hydrolase C-terminal domain-containing protein n=1 Tax=Equus caballus TaxID=9796 RepID=A0A3Q2HLK6_HORSE